MLAHREQLEIVDAFKATISVYAWGCFDREYLFLHALGAWMVQSTKNTSPESFIPWLVVRWTDLSSDVIQTGV